MGVAVSVLLQRKRSFLETLGTDARLSDVAEHLAAHNIGSIVITHVQGTLAGIVSERDIVRQVAFRGRDALDAPVTEVMARDVETCTPATSTDELMRVMTERRVRHIPVVDEDRRLVGIVSIGDVVKWQLEELSAEAAELEAYVTGGHY